MASQAEVTRSSHLAQTDRQIRPVSTAVKRSRQFDVQPLGAGDAERYMPQETGVQLSKTGRYSHVSGALPCERRFVWGRVSGNSAQKCFRGAWYCLTAIGVILLTLPLGLQEFTINREFTIR